MARTKRVAVERTPSDLLIHSNGHVHLDNVANGTPSKPEASSKAKVKETQAGIGTLIFCVGGIYASLYVNQLPSPSLNLRPLTCISLTWALLQERITTTEYGTAKAPEKFTYSVFLNTIQSIFAAISGITYLFAATSHPHKPGRPAPIFPTIKILPPLLLVSITSSLASPFGYAALGYIDYVTYILAKSCKLLPLMALHLTIFRKRYPLHKYLVVAFVTLGVAVFTLHHPSAAKKAAKHSSKGGDTLGLSSNTTWGLFLLGVNLLFDGLFNSTQDYIFTTFRPYSGPQMMCAQNILATLLTTSYLLISPILAPTFIGQALSLPAGNELQEAIAFVSRNPQVGKDVLLFSICGAIGQVFIFHTLASFSSLLLVTVNVTRKMLSMVFSVLWFGHSITGMQWVGVGLVFGGIGGEAVMNGREKRAKDKSKKKE
jgi:UDP-galactose transporter B1